MNTIDLLEDDGQDVNLSKVEKLVNIMLSKEAILAKKEEEVKSLTGEIDELRQKLIPEMMGSLTEVKIQRPDGTMATIKIKPIVRASIKKEDRDSAYEWLEQSGHGSLIKTEITLSFGRDEREKAKQQAQTLREGGLSPEVNATIHWSTLNSWASEQLEKGLELPAVINIFETKIAEVKYGK